MRLAAIVLFLLSFSGPVFSAVPAGEERDAVQTAVSSPIPFNTPSEQAFLDLVGKINFITPTFLSEKLIDSPSQEIDTNTAILTNSFQHNVFYVQVTAKAP